MKAAPIPVGAEVEKNGEYMRIVNAHGHTLATSLGRIPYHRFVLYEALGQPVASKCHWCGYVLPWKTGLIGAYTHVVNADHLNADKSNNEPGNLVPACYWCNANRGWAGEHVKFWADWRRWLADVPPWARPNLWQIALEFGIDPGASGIKPNDLT